MSTWTGTEAMSNVSDTGRAKVRIAKPRLVREAATGEVIVYSESLSGGRMRIYISPGEDMQYVFIEHDDTVEVNVQQKPRNEVRWLD